MQKHTNINGQKTAIAVMDFEYMGGSMGSVVGEKVTSIMEKAIEKSAGNVLTLGCGMGYYAYMVSEKDRFAAPYYKLARIREAKKMYKEALELLMQVKKIDSSYMIDDDIKRIKMILENTDRFKNIATNQINAIKRYENSKNNNEEIFKECKEALKFVPNNTEILYLFSKAASNLNLFYEFKWAIKEYTRVCHSEYDKEIYYYYLIISLGKICKYEKKYEEAKYYFGLIVHDEDIENNAMYFEASEEYKACEALLNNYND